MKPIVIYEHKCKRCDRPFRSDSQTPVRCGKCKSPYWNQARKTKKAA